MNLIILLTVLGAVAYRIASPAERKRYLAVAVDIWRELKDAATRRTPASEAFHAALCARARLPIATWLVGAISVAVGVAVAFAPAAGGETLLSWGASVGPRTTNGEWWRIVTAIFVYDGLPSLILGMLVLAQVGRVLERLVGTAAFAAVYLISGASASLANLSTRPHAVTISSTAAIFGLYGLLLTSTLWQIVRRRRSDPNETSDEQPTRAIAPVFVLKRITILGVVFVAVSALSGRLTPAELTAFVVGAGCGVVLAAPAMERQATIRDAAIVGAIAAAMIVACAIPMRHIADVKPEIARVIDTEARTSAAYQAALEAFKKGKKGADALAAFVEKSIVPELQAADVRLAALTNVPPAHQPLVADAREYLRLRRDSWRLRADAIRRTNTVQKRTAEDSASAAWRLQAEARFRKNMSAVGSAETAERASLDAFERVRQEAAAPLP